MRDRRVLKSLARPKPPKPRLPRVVLLEHLRGMKRVLAEVVPVWDVSRTITEKVVTGTHQGVQQRWAVGKGNVEEPYEHDIIEYRERPRRPDEMPENDPKMWQDLRRQAVWMRDASQRLFDFAAEQEAALWRRMSDQEMAQARAEEEDDAATAD